MDDNKTTDDENDKLLIAVKRHWPTATAMDVDRVLIESLEEVLAITGSLECRKILIKMKQEREAMTYKTLIGGFSDDLIKFCELSGGPSINSETGIHLGGYYCETIVATTDYEKEIIMKAKMLPAIISFLQYHEKQYRSEAREIRKKYKSQLDKAKP